MKKALNFLEKIKFDLKDFEKDHIIQVITRMLHDKRESVVDSAIHVTGQIINKTGMKFYESCQVFQVKYIL